MAVTETPTDAGRPAFDLLDPAFYFGDQHAAYRWMRANEPVYRDRTNGMWGITRHADLHEVERRSDVFSSHGSYRSYPSPGESNMIAQDDPRHAAQRGLVSRRFTPKAVRTGNEAWLRATITDLLDRFGDHEVEVVDALAAQLPSRFTAKLLGWDEERWPDIKRWSERLMRLDRAGFDQQIAMDVMTTILEFNDDLTEMVAERKGCPVHEAPDLMAVWANAEIDGAVLPPESVMHEVGLFISGGAETTRTVIARALRTFCDHPDQWEAMAADAAVVPGAVEEMIRWVTPLNNMFRTALVDTEVGGQAIAAGDRLVLLYPSANRDEAVFTDPDTFDITRSPNPHLGFGFGTHFCLGASLARFELVLLFTELARRFTNLRVVTELDGEENIFANAVKTFTLGYDRR
jgi:cytochrome P450 family 142 subfamily A polypeptide 1